jgi:hypothetical protein
VALIFIDANKYLDFFRSVDIAETIDRLLLVRKHTLVTQQVVDEVQRNKLTVLASCNFSTQRSYGFPELKVLPDNETKQTLLSRVQKAKEEAKSLEQAIETEVANHFDKVSRSEDGISKKLAEFWGTPTQENLEELSRARTRRERGNPPGKSSDCLGDQITWEQLLNAVKGHESLWVITSDADFIAKSDKNYRLNPYLQSELNTAAKKVVLVHCFSTIAEGLDDFIRQNRVLEKNAPTADKVKEQVAAEREAMANTTVHISPLSGPISASSGLASTTISGIPYRVFPPSLVSGQFGSIRSLQNPFATPSLTSRKCPQCGADTFGLTPSLSGSCRTCGYMGPWV